MKQSRNKPGAAGPAPRGGRIRAQAVSRRERIRRALVRGFTLVEALLAAVILAMAIAAITMPFTAGAQHELEAARRTLGVTLAQEMMEEVLSKPFYDPNGESLCGPEAGETRAGFDNIDDYDGYSEADGQIRSFDGSALGGPAVAGLTRHATAKYVYVSGQSHAEPPTFARITVEVKHRDRTIASLNRLVYANR